MLDKAELLAEVERRAGSRAAIARTLNLAPARITEMYKGERNLSYDEAVKLIRTYQLEQPDAESHAIVSVYAVFGSADEARRIARLLVEERLAACANILAPCHSIYRWQGKVEEAPEFPVLFKTAADRSEALLARLTGLHSYDVPAAVVWPIETTPPVYGEWVASETRET